MSYIPLDNIKEAIGTVATGPHGFGIFSEATSGVHVDAQTGGVEVNLNNPSLERAKSGEQKLVREIDAMMPKGSFSALPGVAAKNDSAANQYAGGFAKHGLDKTVGRVLGRRPRLDMRAQMARDAVAKNPLLRIKHRQLLQLRKTFDMIAKRQFVAFNPAMLPQAIPPKSTAVPMSPYVLQQKKLAQAKTLAAKKKNKPKAWAGLITEPSFIMS